MKKILLPLLVILLLTGCSKVNKNTDDYSEVVNNILKINNHNVNTASIGYKYYIPVGVNLIYDSDFNKQFKIKNNKVMLYVDVISYYYKNKLNYDVEMDADSFFSKINDGYISVTENEDNYYLKIVYNYAKIESYVKKENLIDVISYSTIILNSITYNENLINNFIEKGVSFGGEKIYEIDKPDESESKFSQYLQEYVQESDEQEENFSLEQD